MPLDFLKKAVRHLRALFEFFQHVEFQLQLLGGRVQRGDQIGHVSNIIGVKADSENHPARREDALGVGLRADVSESDSRQSLKRPVKRN